MTDRQAADAALVASLAAEIRALRAKKQMTQEAVWSAAGISPSAYKKIENGQEGVARSIEQVHRVANALGLSAADLVQRAEAGMSDYLPADEPAVSLEAVREDRRERRSGLTASTAAQHRRSAKKGEDD